MITEEIKQNIETNYQNIKPLIDKYAKSKPETLYNFFDGWYKSLYWQTNKASVEFLIYQHGEELNAYKSDESEWMELDTGRRLSAIERFGKRQEILHYKKIEEHHVKEAFSWL